MIARLLAAAKRAVSRAKTWLAATRPPTLAAAVIPVAVGTACAAAVDRVRWPAAAAALWGAVWIQIGTNFANDVYDADRGADGPDRLGPTRAVSAGLIDRRTMHRAMWVAFGLACLAGVALLPYAGWAVIAIGVASILAGIAYTGGPYPLGYNGLGDVFVMAFFGLVATAGTAWVQLGHVPALALLAAIPVGALTTAILVVNNVRDAETDARVGKRTLAVRFGRRFGIAEYRALLAASYATPIAMVLSDLAGPAALLPLVTAPLAAKLADDVATKRGRPLNRTLALTAALLLGFGGLLTIGLALT